MFDGLKRHSCRIAGTSSQLNRMNKRGATAPYGSNWIAIQFHSFMTPLGNRETMKLEKKKL